MIEGNILRICQWSFVRSENLIKQILWKKRAAIQLVRMCSIQSQRIPKAYPSGNQEVILSEAACTK